MNTPLVMVAAVVLGLAFPGSTAQAQCGGNEQTPCKVWERIPSCDSGLKEDFGQGKCVKMATPCGAVGQRPCLITERVLSCNPGSYEDLGKNLCVKKTACGAADQRPCRIDERIPSCDKGLYEDMGQGKCLVHGDYLRDGFEKCVHVPGASDANGVQLRTWDCSAHLAHLTWEKVPLLLDFASVPEEVNVQPFWLKNRLTGKCAAVHAGQKDDGAAVIQWDCGSGKNFQWGWRSSGQLIHRESQKCLHSESGGHNVPLTIAKCAEIEVPKEKQWTYIRKRQGIKVGDLTDENMPGHLRNGRGPCLQAPDADGDQLTMWTCDSNLSQVMWRSESALPDKGSVFKNVMTGHCAAVKAGEKNAGTAVIQWPCLGAQVTWSWTMMGDQLMNNGSGKCLEVVKGKAVLGTCVEIVVPDNKNWTMVKPNGETYR